MTNVFNTQFVMSHDTYHVPGIYTFFEISETAIKAANINKISS